MGAGGGCPVNWWFGSSHSPALEGKGNPVDSRTWLACVPRQMMLRDLCRTRCFTGLCAQTLQLPSSQTRELSQGDAMGGCPAASPAPMSPCLPAAASGGHELKGHVSPSDRLHIGSASSGSHRGAFLCCRPQGSPPAQHTRHHPGPSCRFSGVQGIQHTTIWLPRLPSTQHSMALTCVLFHLLDPSIPAQGRERS